RGRATTGRRSVSRATDDRHRARLAPLSAYRLWQSRARAARPRNAKRHQPRSSRATNRTRKETRRILQRARSVSSSLISTRFVPVPPVTAPPGWPLRRWLARRTVRPTRVFVELSRRTSRGLLARARPAGLRSWNNRRRPSSLEGEQ